MWSAASRTLPPWVKTPNARAKPILWEPERVDRWKATGEVPGPVMVWTDDLPAQFLDHTTDHAPDLHPLLHLMAYRGPRHGEAWGLLDAEVRLTKGEVSIVNRSPPTATRPARNGPRARPATGRSPSTPTPSPCSPPTRPAATRGASPPALNWPDTGLFFVRPDGKPWHPNTVTQRFRRLVKQAGLPPVRLHDLRHSAATLALDAGVDIKVVSDQFGHSTTTLTRDTYQSAKRLHHEAATAVADRIKNKRRRTA